MLKNRIKPFYRWNSYVAFGWKYIFKIKVFSYRYWEKSKDGEIVWGIKDIIPVVIGSVRLYVFQLSRVFLKVYWRSFAGSCDLWREQSVLPRDQDVEVRASRGLWLESAWLLHLLFPVLPRRPSSPPPSTAATAATGTVQEEAGSRQGGEDVRLLVLSVTEEFLQRTTENCRSSLYAESWKKWVPFSFFFIYSFLYMWSS